MIEEVWKTIEEFSNYKISNKGRVKSFMRNKEIVKKTFFDRKGYEIVNLTKEGKSFHKKIHRLVAFAFIENPLDKPQVNHKDGNKKNNSECNLEWATDKENKHHAYENNLYTNGCGSNFILAGNNKKPIIQMDINGNFLKEHDSIKNALKFIGKKINSSNIARACKNNKTAYGFLWKYKK